MIDVRTKAEWAFVGVPDLGKMGKKPILLEWHGFPDNRVQGDFAERLAEALSAVGADKNSELLFLCRSGGRSLKVAEFLRAQGIDATNVAGGTLAWIEAGHATASGIEPG